MLNLNLNEEKHTHLNIHPIPAINQLEINSPFEIRQITLYNQSGFLIENKNYSSVNNVNLPLVGYSPGMYFIEIQHKGGLTVRKIIIQ